ncbi:hypothetical protein [Pantoea ananatis]|jgi:hypothetical protein|uniref:hypothetical protein n=1 Tax=Pantoea ananas TaxID=553 RepID=UPI001B30BAC0|nr:hypothetical protein [Pantoea ananatis]
MKNKLLKEGKLLDEDVKLVRQQIIFRKSGDEVINFMVNQLGLARDEAMAVYDEIVIECHGSWRNVKKDKP